MKIATIAAAAAAVALTGFAATSTFAGDCGSCTSSKKADTYVAAGDYGEKQKDIVATAIGAGKFNTLATALTEAGLVETLQGDGPFTVFAPKDEAFAALPEGALDGLLADKEALKNVLLYHVVAGQAVAAETVITLDGQSVETANGGSVAISVVDGKVMLNGDIEVIKTDVKASNGIIHVIDGVLLP
ncbi:MAG: fasciclin domain-containing protein [Planctomycetota bacterium]